MDWDEAFLTTKVVLFVVCGLLLSIGNAVASCFVGTLIFLICRQDIGMLAIVPTILGAASMYGAGVAGRRILMTEILPDLFFSKNDLNMVNKDGQKGD